MNWKIVYFLTCLSVRTLCNAQSDTTLLSYKEYLENILRFHPIVKQAQLKLNNAEAEWQAAKGNFDPVIISSWNEKNFDDKLYYQEIKAKLTIPTRLGIDIIAGYEDAQGIFLNPAETTDEFGLWNIGLEINLLQGLWINERRVALKKARIFRQLAKNQQQVLLNALVYAASIAYMEWQQYYFFAKAIRENMKIAQKYFENTKQAFENGEKTTMDTLEAFILLQDVTIFLQTNETKLVKSRQQLENYLWYNDLPLIIQSHVQPQPYENPIFNISNQAAIPDLINNHPVILEKINKQSMLTWEQRLKREKLKPKLKAKLNPLIATSEDGFAPHYSRSDYKWGFKFSYPLFIRSERAAVWRGKIKLENISFDIINKKNELQNKIENTLQTQAILREQIALQRVNTAGYKQLLEAENEKFRYGESSVFLLNKRQEKYISGQLKLIELNIKLQKSLLNYLYYTNTLMN